MLQDIEPGHVFLSLGLRNTPRTPLARHLPHARAVDGLAIRLEPFSDLQQTFLHDHRNPAVGARPDIQAKIPAAAHNIDQHKDQFLSRTIIFQIFGTVVAIRETHAAVLFPGMGVVIHTGAVFGRIESAVFVPNPFAPAVIDDQALFIRRIIEQPG